VTYRVGRLILAARPLLALLALPLVLLAFNDAWSWDSTAFYDNHVYVGFFRHYVEFNYPYVENYKSSRLPFLYPGILLYRLLPPEAAHHALFLLFLVGEAAMLFLWARRRVGPYGAFAVAAAQAAFTYGHTGPSYHNGAASTYFVASLLLLDAPSRRASWRRALTAGAAFAAAVATDSIVAGLAPVFALYALAAVPRPRRPLAIFQNALAALAGAVLAFAAFGAVNAALGGPVLFFMEQVRATMNVVHKRSLSRVPLAEFLHVWRFGWLTLPAFAAVASFAMLVVQALRRRFDQGALAALAFFAAMAVAIAMHARGLGMLEYPHLFHPFFAPTFLVLAAILRPRVLSPTATRAALSPRFVLVAVFALIVPLSLLGATWSRLLLDLGRRSPQWANGSLLAFAVLAVAIVAGFVARRSPKAVALVAVAAFGLVNALNAPASQPAYTYDARSRCSFRRDFFSALIEADPLFSAFDPTNHARYLVGPVGFDEPQFDGRGWCARLPVGTVWRDIILSHYFYTTVQFTNGAFIPGPLRKVVVAAGDASQIEAALRQFRAKHPANLVYTEAFSKRITRPTFSVLVRGYDVSAP
jgi:hypothetical protein